MIRVSALYPNGNDARFDHDYYHETHRELVNARWSRWLRGIEMDRGVAGAGGTAAPFIGGGHLYFDSLEDFQAAFDAHGEEILGDIPNFTNTQPVLQISSIEVERKAVAIPEPRHA